LAWSASARTDLLAFTLVEPNVALFLGMAMFFGVTYVAQHQIVRVGATLGPLSIASPLLAIVAFFVVIDFVNYWTHRACHRVPLLWTIHRYHHSAPEMTILTAGRDHPMERAFASMMSALPVALMSVPAEQFFVLMLLAKGIGLLKHSNVTSNWGFIGRWVIQSPAAHRIHHSIDTAHHNTNFASLFQFWDVLFGTAMHPSNEQTRAVRMGVEGDDGQRAPLRYIGEVFVELGRGLRKLIHV
jgi:sterol desaturase/sphingolipid hydroxylase (fatty acid hydroxylase superfamily)